MTIFADTAVSAPLLGRRDSRGLRLQHLAVVFLHSGTFRGARRLTLTTPGADTLKIDPGVDFQLLNLSTLPCGFSNDPMFAKALEIDHSGLAAAYTRWILILALCCRKPWFLFGRPQPTGRFHAFQIV